MSNAIKWPGKSLAYAKIQQMQVEQEFERGDDVREALNAFGLFAHSQPRDVMDVGGGIGRAIYHMHRRWADQSSSCQPRYWLYDDFGEKQHAGIRKDLTDDTFYSNHDVAVEWLDANEVYPVNCLNARDRDRCREWIEEEGVKMDLVTSFRAVGFHWPMHPLLDFLGEVTALGSFLLFESRPLDSRAYPDGGRFVKGKRLTLNDLESIAGHGQWQLLRYRHIRVGPHLRGYVLAERV